MKHIAAILFFVFAVSITAPASALEAEDEGVHYEGNTFTEYNIEFYPAPLMGRYYVNYARWVNNIRAVVNLTFGDKLAGSILFLDDRTPLPPPEEQPKRGGYVLYHHWREFFEFYTMLTTYKGVGHGSFGTVFRKKYDDGTIIYGLDMAQIPLERTRRMNR